MFDRQNQLTANEGAGLATLFGMGHPQVAPGDPLEIGLGVIGRGHAGKTALFRALYRGTVQHNLPSQLQFDVDDPLATAKLVQEARATFEMLHERGLPQTLEPEEIVFHLFEAETKRVVLRFREVVGQILTHTTADSPPEQKAKYSEYLTHLAACDVKWIVVSCPRQRSTPDDLRRYEDDLLLTKSYLREALRWRTNSRPCSVAIVMTKIDTLFENEDEARAQLPDERLIEALRPLVNMVLASEKVSQAAIFPVTAFGFGNAIVRQLSSETTQAVTGPRSSAGPLEDEESEWILKPGVTPEPFNVASLIVWSLLAGMLYQEVDVDEDGEAAMARICRMLHSDLETLNGWHVPIRGTVSASAGSGNSR